MKILIIGRSGLLGRSFVSDKHKIYGTYSNHMMPSKNNIRLDIRQHQKVNELIKKINPDVVVNTAYLNNVNLCETLPENTQEVNILGTYNLAKVCAKHKIKFVFFSTDYVFDGKRGPYKEGDKPNPISIYGQSKVFCEDFIKKMQDYLIIRTTVIYGYNPNRLNFVTWVIDRLGKKRRVRIVTDQYGNPTYAPDLAAATITLLEKNATGLYHLAGSTHINRYDFSKQICNAFKLDSRLIKPITSEELNQIAKRPLKAGFICSKAEKLMGRKMLGTTEGLNKFKKELETHER